MSVNLVNLVNPDNSVNLDNPDNINITDEKFMKIALLQAEKAAKSGEVPVGAVLIKDGKVISRGYNKREIKKNALAHAEILAISKGCKKLGGWRLFGCTLYVTLEPCPMCAGAISNARIDRVVFGAFDLKNGAFGSVFNMNDYYFNHKIKITSGISEEKCSEILKKFFKELRVKKRIIK